MILFDFSGLGTRVLLAPGSSSRIKEEVERAGVKRVMLFCGGKTARNALVASVRKLLGNLIVAEFAQVSEHSSTSAVHEACDRARTAQADLLLAIGGGSASDTAKAVAIVLAEGGPINRHANIFTPPDHYVQRVLPMKKVPIVVIPTTLSAAEVTPGLGIRNEEDGRKLVFWDSNVVPAAILLDPQANLEVPTQIMATTGLNAFAHCIEGLYSRVRNPISEGLALQGIRLLYRSLPTVVASPQDVDARAEALVGAHLSGMVIANARVGIHHGVCNCLGAFGGLSHGVANAVFLPHAMRYNLDVAAEQLQLTAAAMGLDVRGLPRAQAAEKAIEATANLQSLVKAPSRLRDTGIGRAKFPEIARQSMGDRGLYFNPRPVGSIDEVMRLLDASW